MSYLPELRRGSRSKHTINAYCSQYGFWLLCIIKESLLWHFKKSSWARAIAQKTASPSSCACTNSSSTIELLLYASCIPARIVLLRVILSNRTTPLNVVLPNRQCLHLASARVRKPIESYMRLELRTVSSTAMRIQNYFTSELLGVIR